MNKIKEIKRRVRNRFRWKVAIALIGMPEGKIKKAIYNHTDKWHFKNEINSVVAGLPEEYLEDVNKSRP